MSNWKNVWDEAKYATELLIRDRLNGEIYFNKMLQTYGNDAMIFYQWAVAYENIGEKKLALENYKIAKNKFPMLRWQEEAQRSIDRIEYYLSLETSNGYLADDEIVQLEEYKLFVNFIKSVYVRRFYGGYYSDSYRAPRQCNMWLDIIDKKLNLSDSSFSALKVILLHEVESDCYKHINGLVWGISEAAYSRGYILSFFDKANSEFSKSFKNIKKTPETLFHLAVLIKAYNDVNFYYLQQYNKENDIDKLAIGIEFLLWKEYFLKVDTVKLTAGQCFEYEEIDTSNASVADICEAMANVSADFLKLEISGKYGTKSYAIKYKMWNPFDSEKQYEADENTSTNWHTIWKDAISANSTLIRNREYGESRFKDVIEKYGEDGMIFFEWGLAYDTIGEKKLALEKLRVAKEKLPLEHWRERAQFCIDRIEKKPIDQYPHFIQAMIDVHSYLYSEKVQEQELKYLLISSLPNVETETASILIYFRVALESFLDAVAKYANIKLSYKLANDTNLICRNLNNFTKIKDEMDRIRQAGNAKIHANPTNEDKRLAESINDRIDDFLKILRFYKSESEVSKLCRKK